MNKLVSSLSRFPLFIKVLLVLLVGATGWFVYSKTLGAKKQSVQYQTATVERGTIVVSVSGSGTVSSANNASVTTNASGVVSTVYAHDGDHVNAGDKIAEIDLDLSGKQKAAQALASYQSAKNNLDSAQTTYYTLQSDLFTNWKTYMDVAQNSTYQNGDGSPNTSNRQLPQFYSTQDEWLAAESKYKNQQGVVAAAQSSLNSAWFSYQQSSPTIVAPITGTIAGLSLQPGTIITQSNSSSTTTTISSQKVANVVTNAMPSVSLNLTEVDAPKIHIGDKATITLDAFADKTFTGKVVSIDTVGSVSSGVTTYPTTIALDTDVPGILPNMSATANIITATKTDVLTIPSTAIQTQNGEPSVQIMKNGKPQQTAVETGLVGASDTEIVSGLSEGDTVVTGTIGAATTARTGQTTSPFSAFGGAGGGFRAGGGGGGNFRIAR